MPTYVYRRADGSRFEVFQSITAPPLTACPTTNQSVERVISGGTGFILKGSGFYQTDYVSRPNGADSPENAEAEDKEANVPADEEPKSKKEPAETHESA